MNDDDTRVTLPDLDRLDVQQLRAALSAAQARLAALNVGGTPVTEVTIGGTRVHLKREDLSTTKAYTERGATTAVLYARSLGYRNGVLASTGNFANGVAAACGLCGAITGGAITGGVDEREVRPSHRCEVSNNEQPHKSGSANVARDWATRRSQSRDFEMEIPEQGGAEERGQT